MSYMLSFIFWHLPFDTELFTVPVPERIAGTDQVGIVLEVARRHNGAWYAERVIIINRGHLLLEHADKQRPCANPATDRDFLEVVDALQIVYKSGNLPGIIAQQI